MVSFVGLLIIHRDRPHCVRTCPGTGHKLGCVLCPNRIDVEHGHYNSLQACSTVIQSNEYLSEKSCRSYTSGKFGVP